MLLTEVSNGSKNAVGEMIPVRFFTTIAMPVSMKGSLKSTTASRSAFIINDVNTISAFRFINSAISPFHLPFSSVPHRPSSTRTNSYVKPIYSKYVRHSEFLEDVRFDNYSPNGSANFSNKSIQNPLQHW